MGADVLGHVDCAEGAVLDADEEHEPAIGRSGPVSYDYVAVHGLTGSDELTAPRLALILGMRVLAAVLEPFRPILSGDDLCRGSS